MKKKLFLMVVMAFVFALALTLAVCAESIHNENTVDYNATVTLNDGAVLPLYDENKNALIWYTDGKDEEGKTKYSSVRADDPARVTWKAESWDEVQSWDAFLEDGTTSIKSKIVVINLMDDDVIRNTGNAKFLNKPVDNFKRLFEGMKLLEYCYLRLDTKTINTHSFNGCSKLKYINLENLTQLQRMAQSSQFSGCTSLFDGQVLDLTRTQLYEFEGSSTFSGVPFIGVKFPETMVKIGSNTTFNNCTKLEFVSIGNKAKFYGTPFSGCTSLKAIYYVGTEDDLSASTIGNVVENAMIKSYADYKALSDKNGVYIVYDYSWCEAFNQGVHGTINVTTNACVGTCSVCGDTIVDHKETNVTVSISYTDFSVAGTKTITCQNAGCGKVVTEEAPALFKLDGFSTPTEYGKKGLAIGFEVNEEALSAYKATGKTLTFGAYIVGCEKLGANDVYTFDGAVKAEVTESELTYFSMKVTGFEKGGNDDTKLCLGAYIVEENGDVSYLQAGEAEDGCNFLYTTYNLAYANSSNK